MNILRYYLTASLSLKFLLHLLLFLQRGMGQKGNECAATCDKRRSITYFCNWHKDEKHSASRMGLV